MNKKTRKIFYMEQGKKLKAFDCIDLDDERVLIKNKYGIDMIVTKESLGEFVRSGNLIESKI